VEAVPLQIYKLRPENTGTKFLTPKSENERGIKPKTTAVRNVSGSLRRTRHFEMLMHTGKVWLLRFCVKRGKTVVLTAFGAETPTIHFFIFLTFHLLYKKPKHKNTRDHNFTFFSCPAPREEDSLKVSENRIFRTTFGPKEK
jgi:hypothetical protein